jgi:protein-disulfide isomerase
MKSIKIFFSAILFIGSLGFAAPSQESLPGPLVIEEFADFECVYCAQGNETMKAISDHYRDKIKLVFRNFPLSFHKYSLLAAKAYTAITLQDQLLAQRWRNRIFENQRRLKEEGETFVFEVATQVGVDLETMKKDMASTVVDQMIEQDRKRAEELGFKGTPSFLIGSERVQGTRSFEEFKNIIDQQLAPKTP